MTKYEFTQILLESHGPQYPWYVEPGQKCLVGVLYHQMLEEPKPKPTLWRRIKALFARKAR